MRIQGNKVLITGGSKGIGLAMAIKFLELGNEVIITGRDIDSLEEVKKEYPKVIVFRCDQANKSDIDCLVVFIENHHADLNILINNAGVQYNYNFILEPNLLQRVEQEIKINFLGPVQIISLLLPTLQQNKEAAIVNISSALGLVPKQSAPIYCGTKAGIHIFTKALRYQLTDVKVFEVIPSLVETAMTKGRGKGKISSAQLVDEFIKSFKKDRFEINIGKVKWLRLIQRIIPSLADRIIKRG